jgi:hypothetical protein
MTGAQGKPHHLQVHGEREQVMGGLWRATLFFQQVTATRIGLVCKHPYFLTNLELKSFLSINSMIMRMLVLHRIEGDRRLGCGRRTMVPFLNSITLVPTSSWYRYRVPMHPTSRREANGYSWLCLHCVTARF